MDDTTVAMKLLSDLPVHWDGKKSILELKEADYNWKQMEWPGFYFEWMCNNKLKQEFEIPGETINNVEFDAKRTINWDFKASSNQASSSLSILNDCQAMEMSMDRHGSHGLIIAKIDVEYDDENRSFQQWQEELKGGKSKYELRRIKRTSRSRLRKVNADLRKLYFVNIQKKYLDKLKKMKQGRNSNGKPRPPKYMIDVAKLEKFPHKKIEFDKTN